MVSLKVKLMTLLSVSFLFSSVARSQTPAPVVDPDKGQSDAKSQDILKKVSALYQGYSTITASFTLTTVAEGKKPLVSKGTVWIKGAQFKLDYAQQEIYCNGKTIWTYNPDDQEVTVEEYKKRDNSITPNEIFTVYSKGFKSKYEGPTTGTSNKVYESIKLVPKKKANYAYVKLEIDKSNYKINKVVQHYKNGTEVTIEINKLTPNTSLKDEFFAWTDTGHEGVTVVDLTKPKKKKK